MGFYNRKHDGGPDVDLEEAKKYYEKALFNGDRNAGRLLDEIEKSQGNNKPKPHRWVPNLWPGATRFLVMCDDCCSQWLDTNAAINTPSSTMIKNEYEYCELEDATSAPYKRWNYIAWLGSLIKNHEDNL